MFISPLLKGTIIFLTSIVNGIIDDGMNKMKEILKEGWDVFPPWLLVGHGLLITVSLLIIFFGMILESIWFYIIILILGFVWIYLTE